MSRRMTLVFDDEELYTTIKVEAARRHRPAKDLVAEALREWLEAQEDAELLLEIEAARAEWEEKGGVEAGEFFRRLEVEEKARGATGAV
ncbi:MAG: hypothetical protein Q8P59_03280 [Dehalococcoidia bacterium]|nr:hypothetical protein [Dehalococcoidia bacterium]